MSSFLSLLNRETITIAGGDPEFTINRVPRWWCIQGVCVAARLETLGEGLIAQHFEGDVPGLVLAGKSYSHRVTELILEEIAA